MEIDMNMTKKARANSIITTRRFDMKQYFTVAGAVGPELVVILEQMSMECRSRAMFHGIEQRVRDAGALLRDTSNGKSATPQEKYDSMARVCEHLNSGATEWRLKATEDTGGLIVQALMRVKSFTLEQANAMIERTATKHEIDREAVLKNLAKNADIVRAVGDIRAERAAASSVDATSYLDEMDELEDDGETAPE
jgi:hypothetical protein